MSAKRSSLPPVAVGVAEHNGWAILVSAAAINGQPTVVDRRRVPLIERDVPNQPYHHETLALPDADAEQLLRRVRKSVAACTEQAFARLSGDLSSRYRVSSIAIRQPPLPRLPATVAAVHASYYVQCRADGMLYHSAICAAARRLGWSLVVLPRGEELAKAAEAMQMGPAEMEKFVNSLRRKLGPPWAADHRRALAAAIAALKNQP